MLTVPKIDGRLVARERMAVACRLDPGAPESWPLFLLDHLVMVERNEGPEAMRQQRDKLNVVGVFKDAFATRVADRGFRYGYPIASVISQIVQEGFARSSIEAHAAYGAHLESLASGKR